MDACPCGCGKPVPTGRKWAGDGCRQRAWNSRHYRPRPQRPRLHRRGHMRPRLDAHHAATAQILAREYRTSPSRVLAALLELALTDDMICDALAGELEGEG